MSADAVAYDSFLVNRAQYFNQIAAQGGTIVVEYIPPEEENSQPFNIGIRQYSGMSQEAMLLLSAEQRLYIPVDDLPILPQAHNALKQQRLQFVGDLVQKTQSDLMYLMADTSSFRQMEVIEDTLGTLGFELGQEVENYLPETRRNTRLLKVDWFIASGDLNPTARSRQRSRDGFLDRLKEAQRICIQQGKEPVIIAERHL